MGNGVKVLERPIEETSYVRATLTGMVTTLRHLLNTEKVTIQYPEEKYSLSPRWRGTHRMLTTEDGKAKCVACGLCPTAEGAARAKTRPPPAIRSCSRSPSSAPSSAAPARKGAGGKRPPSAAT